MSSTTRSETLVYCVRQGNPSLVEGVLYADTRSGKVGEAFVYECHSPHSQCCSISFADGSVRSYLWHLHHLRMPTAREKARFRRERWEYARG